MKKYFTIHQYQLYRQIELIDWQARFLFLSLFHFISRLTKLHSIYTYKLIARPHLKLIANRKWITHAHIRDGQQQIINKVFV